MAKAEGHLSTIKNDADAARSHLQEAHLHVENIETVNLKSVQLTEKAKKKYSIFSEWIAQTSESNALSIKTEAKERRTTFVAKIMSTLCVP